MKFISLAVMALLSTSHAVKINDMEADDAEVSADVQA